MDHVAHCIEKMVDLSMDDFQPEEIDMSDCIKVVTTRKLGADGNPIKDLQGNKLMEEVKLITSADRFDAKSELQKHQMKIKEEEYRTFESNKKLCLGAENYRCVQEYMPPWRQYLNTKMWIKNGIWLAH